MASEATSAANAGRYKKSDKRTQTFKKGTPEIGLKIEFIREWGLTGRGCGPGGGGTKPIGAGSGQADRWRNEPIFRVAAGVDGTNPIRSEDAWRIACRNEANFRSRRDADRVGVIASIHEYGSRRASGFRGGTP